MKPFTLAVALVIVATVVRVPDARPPRVITVAMPGPATALLGGPEAREALDRRSFEPTGDDAAGYGNRHRSRDDRVGAPVTLIEGRVRVPDAAARVAGALVSLSRDGLRPGDGRARLEAVVRSDAAGRFRFVDVAPGAHHLVVSATGFAPGRAELHRGGRHASASSRSPSPKPQPPHRWPVRCRTWAGIPWRARWCRPNGPGPGWWLPSPTPMASSACRCSRAHTRSRPAPPVTLLHASTCR